MEKLKLIAIPIAYNKEKKITYLATETQIIGLNDKLKKIYETRLKNSTDFKSYLVCNNKVLIIADDSARIMTYDLENKKNISKPKNDMEVYMYNDKFNYDEKNSLIFVIGMNNNKHKVLYSYRIDENGTLTIEDEFILNSKNSDENFIGHKIFKIENDKVYILEFSENEKYETAFLTYDINNKSLTTLWKETNEEPYFQIYDEYHIINQSGTEVKNVFTKEASKILLDYKIHNRYISNDKKYLVIWNYDTRKLYIRDSETCKVIKTIEYKFFFNFSEIDNHVYVLGDNLYVYTKEEFYK